MTDFFIVFGFTGRIWTKKFSRENLKGKKNNVWCEALSKEKKRLKRKEVSHLVEGQRPQKSTKIDKLDEPTV